jgi:hypothetical protein
MKKIFLLVLFFLSCHSYCYSLDKQDIQKLKDHNYPLKSFYIDNYKDSKTYWISIEKHLELKPKFVAMVLLDVKLNGKDTKYEFIYNSRHNFFKMVKVKKEKKFYQKLYIFTKSELQPSLMNDDRLTYGSFIEKVLDHCHFSEIKGVKDSEGKSLRFSKRGECKIKFVNFVQFENLTFEKFEENSDLSSYLVNKKDAYLITEKTVQKSLKNDQEKTSKKNNKKTKKISEYRSLALSWSTFDDLIVGKMRLGSGTSNGDITLELTKENNTCEGTFVISESYVGTWSIVCPDNDNRQLGFKKNMMASGTIKKNENGHLIGKGKDSLGKKVRFVSERF